jgi:hypothetical protein
MMPQPYSAPKQQAMLTSEEKAWIESDEYQKTRADKVLREEPKYNPQATIQFARNNGVDVKDCFKVKA